MTLEELITKHNKSGSRRYVYVRTRHGWSCAGNYTKKADADRRIREINANTYGTWDGAVEVVTIQTHETQAYIGHEINEIEHQD